MPFASRLFLAVLAVTFPLAAACAEELASLPPPRANPPPEVVPRAGHPAIFASREIHASDISAFSKWTSMLARWHEERRQSKVACTEAGDESGKCIPAEWLSLVAEMRGLEPREMIERVNQAMNRHPYVTALANWGDPGYWETPFEFLRRNGQCEDYAIAKFMLLREAGIANDQLRLVVLQDTRQRLDHAVLVVYIGGEAWLLDNLIRNVVPVSSVTHYRPYYAINETGWWLYLPNPLMPASTLQRQIVIR